MNNSRRKKLEKIWTALESIRDEEDAAYDNLLEGLEDSEQGQVIDENIDTLGEAMDVIREIIDR